MASVEGKEGVIDTNHSKSALKTGKRFQGRIDRFSGSALTLFRYRR